MTVDEYLVTSAEFTYKTKESSTAITLIRWLDQRPCTYLVVKNELDWLFTVRCMTKDAMTIANFLKTREETAE